MYDTPQYLKTPPNGVVRKGAHVSQSDYGLPWLPVPPRMQQSRGRTPHALLVQNPAYGSVGKGLAVGAGVAGLAGLVLLPGLLIYPWIIKQFKPEWGYGKRVAAGLAIGYATTFIKDVFTPPEVKLAQAEAREQERIRRQQERAAEVEERARDWERQVAASYARAAQ